jgi:hypothetical protein
MVNVAAKDAVVGQRLDFTAIGNTKLLHLMG